MKFSKRILDILDREEVQLEKLIEEKQIELIHYPERREKALFLLPEEDGGISFIYINKEDTPMSVFREVVQLRFFLYYKLYKNPPKECLIKCANYLRMLPEDVRRIYLYAYHKFAAEKYSEYEEGEKADYHLRQALKYDFRGNDDGFDEEEGDAINMVLEKSKDDVNSYLIVLTKILSYALIDRDRENLDNLYEWDRNQYELIEKSLGEAISIYGENADYPIEVRAYFYFCQSVYYNQTRRYTLAQKALQTVKELLPTLKENEWEDYLLEKIRDKWDEMDDNVRMFIENFMAFVPNEETDDELEEDEEEDENEDGDEDREYTFDELYELAEEGNSNAQVEVGLAYESGNGVTANPRIAFEWMWMAAHNGNAIGATILGVYYSNGVGVEQDLKEAFRWYKSAAERDDSDGQYNLAVCYDLGEGIEQNKEEAFKWYKKAAKQKHPDAQYNLAVCYDKEGNIQEAIKWYKLAVEQGNAYAAFNLGTFYYEGEQVKQDYALAFHYFKLAAEQDDPRAQFNLAICYSNGEGVEADEEEAMRWLQQSASQGFKEAILLLDEIVK